MKSFFLLHLTSPSLLLASDGVFPRVVPTRLQFFEYEHISFYCEGFQRSLGWRLMKNISSKNSSCGTSWGFLNKSVCIIRDVYVDDSGEYWCETREGEKSGTVTISVTGRSTAWSLTLVFPGCTEFFSVLLHWLSPCGCYSTTSLVHMTRYPSMLVHQISYFPCMDECRFSLQSVSLQLVCIVSQVICIGNKYTNH